jgi:hypothetical protein
MPGKKRNRQKAVARAAHRPAAPAAAAAPSSSAPADKPVRGTSVVEPQDPPGADVATGRYVVPPRDRAVE